MTDANFWWAIAATALLWILAKAFDGQESLLFVVTYFAISARLDAAAGE